MDDNAMFWKMVGQVYSMNDRNAFAGRSMDEVFEERWTYYVMRSDGGRCRDITKKEAHEVFVDGWLDDRENTARKGTMYYRFDSDKFAVAVEGFVGDRSLRTASEAVDVSVRTLANFIEREPGVTPTLEALVKLCNAMQISPDKFFTASHE